MQYRVGHVTVTNGSNSVVGDVTSFTTSVSVGDLFTVVGSGVTYIIASITNDNTILLNLPYAGPTASGASYTISKSFTPNQNLPYPEKGDIETTTILKAAFLQLDNSLALDTVITTPSVGNILTYNGTEWINATLAGAAGEVTVSESGSTVTINLPQALNTASSPTFAGLTLSGSTLGVSSTYKALTLNGKLIGYSNLTNALDYCTVQQNTGGSNGGASITAGSNVLTITPNCPTPFTSAVVGMSISVAGAFAGARPTIASYISPTQVTLSSNAVATANLSTAIWYNVGQDDQSGITATLAAAGGNKAKSYFPARVYVYDAESTNPATLQGIIADGDNQTFFIAKNNSVVGNFLNVSQAPTDFTLGGVGLGFHVSGPGAVTPIHCTSLTIAAGGVSTVTVDNSQTAPVGVTHKILLAIGGAYAYNETYWKVTSSSSTQWIGTPVYWDGNPATGTISNVSVDGSGNVTVLESNPYRRIGYVNYFSGLTNATFLNGTSLAVSSIVYSGTTVTGYVYASTNSTYASAADTGTVCNFAAVSTITDNFAAIRDHNGIRLSSNVLTTGNHIAYHPNIYGITCNNFPGAGIRTFTQNYGYNGENTTVSNNEGMTFESTYPTTGWYSNTSCFEVGGSCQVTANTLVGMSITYGAGVTVTMPGCNGNGIGVLLNGCNGVVINGFDCEANTPWAVDSTIAPGHAFDVRGGGGNIILPGYLSFNSSVNQIGVKMWKNANGCKYVGGSHNLGGALVAPINEFYIDSSCIGCSVDEPRMLSSSAWTNLSNSSTVKIQGNYYFNGGSAQTFNLQNTIPATSGGNHSSSTLNFIGTNYTSGGASVQDIFGFQNQIAAGANGIATLLISHNGNGTTGGSQVSLNGNFIVSGGGQLVRYNSLAVVAPGVAALQGKTTLSAQSAIVSSTNILGATTQQGIYRVSVYIECTQAPTTSGTLPDSRIIYTNQVGTTITRQATVGVAVTNANALTTLATSDFLINVGAATNINFDIGQVTPYASSGATPLQFAYRVKLEYLG